MTVLVMFGLLFFGTISYRSLPVSNLPNVDFPTIKITAGLPGASPETMASTVATPLEKQFSVISGLASMTSTSTLGSTTIVLQFSLERDIDAAAQDVNAAISLAMKQLPRDMPNPPMYRKSNPSESSIIRIALTSDTLPVSALNDYGEILLSQEFSTIDGVAEVLIFGAQRYAVRVQVNPQLLANRGIGINEVENAIRSGNVNTPGGTLDNAHRTFTLMPSGRRMDAEAYKPLIVAYQNGYPVRIQDIGKTFDGVENDKLAAWYINKNESRRSVVLAIKKQPGSNTVKISEAVKARLPKLVKMLPESVNMEVIYDQSDFINESFRDVQVTLLITIILVVIVIVLFVRAFMPAFIPSVAIILSIVATFIVMYLLGYSLNNLSLMALILSVGFVVDDAVVVLENIIRRMENGENAMAASLNGSKEIGFTVLSMTVSLVIVFVPILFLGGMVGRLFREFAVSIGTAILISGFIALTLTPMMCSMILKDYGRNEKGLALKAGQAGIFLLCEKAFNAMLGYYSRTLLLVLKYRLFTMIVTAAIMGCTIYLFTIIPKGFIPSHDMNYFTINMRTMESASFDDTVMHQKTAEKVVMSDPDVTRVMSAVGVSGGNTGQIFVIVKDAGQRKRSVDDIIRDIRPKINSIPGLKTTMTNPPAIQIGAKTSDALYQFTMQSTKPEDLYAYAAIMEEKINVLPGLSDVNSDLFLKNPTVYIDMNSDKVSALGLTYGQIEDALYASYGTKQVSTIYGSSNQYYVILEVEPQYRMDPAVLSLLYIKSNKGKLVPLSTVAKIKEGVGPSSVNHWGQVPSVTISFNLLPGYSLGKVIDDIRKIVSKTCPQTITTSFGGAAAVFETSFADLGLLLFFTVVVIYMILGILYESYLHPVTILSSLPLAGFGALVTLMIFGLNLDIYAFVGIIMLIGLVKKNGIMMVDFALDIERQEGINSEQSIYQASLVRFRPIMMTTMAALLGTLPIALGLGAGGESRKPLGVAVVGGLFFSQLLTLYVTPVFYVYLDELNIWIKKRKGNAAPAKTG
jgi:HAE1 family hydrophobic/amphiphilic exporter-1